MKARCATIVLIAFSNTAISAGDARRGAQLFGQCMAWHSVKPGEHLTGPSLAHIWNRKAGMFSWSFCGIFLDIGASSKV